MLAKFSVTLYCQIAMATGQTHESLVAHREDVKPPSERSFGITFAVVFAIVGLVPLLHGGTIRLWSLGISLLFLVLAFVAPSALRPLNLIWFKFGLLLHRIVNPVVLGAMFFIAITPMAFVMRRIGKNLLQLEFDPGAKTYWIVRDPPGPSAESVRRQF